MRNLAPNSESMDTEGGVSVASQVSPQPQAEAKSGMAKYQRAIVIGVLSVFFAGLVIFGVSYTNYKQELANESNEVVETTKLHDWDRCGKLQIIVGGGFCEDCPAYSRPDMEKVKCILEACDEGLALLADGTCQKCYPYSRPGPEGRGCIYPTCSQNGLRQRVGYDGACEQCPDYQRSIDLPIKCEEPSCGAGERLSREAICVACPEYTIVKSNNRYSCVFPECGNRSAVTRLGGCQDCRDYERIFEDHKVCKRPACSGPREIVTREGNCFQCPSYEMADASNTSCVPRNCGPRQRITPEAECEDCPAHFIVDPASNGRRCIKANCSGNSIFEANGTCRECGPYMKPTPDRLSCQIYECADKTQSIAASGECHRDFQNDHDTYFQRYTELQRTCGQWENGCADKEAEIVRLTAINTGFAENVRARELEITQIRTRMLELEESLGTHDATINTLRGNIRTLEFEMEAKQQYIDSIERTSISLQETINSKDIRIRELEIALSKARNELAVCENDDQKIILEQRIRSIEADIERERGIAASLREEIRQNSELISQLRGDIARLQGDSGNSNSLIEEQRRQRIVLQEELDRQTEFVRVLQEQIATERALTQQIRGELAAFRSGNQQANLQLEQQRAQSAALEQSIANERQQIENVSRELQRFREQYLNGNCERILAGGN